MDDKTELTVKQIAELMSVSERSIYQAGRIIREGRPEIVEAVRQGHMSLAAALRTIDDDDRRTLSATFPAELAAQVEADAARRGVSVSEWLRAAATAYMQS